MLYINIFYTLYVFNIFYVFLTTNVFSQAYNHEQNIN